ncbi:allophanate hydrolase [Calidifontimicrobium sp. SYSU G02091]|uniref:allophanate hydrolase n=1 Tax=Calidifontimicrobium sp. SYSU G02091 TaxID=2926421 RepID=UPI001F52DDC9|nr:allophanate hydrolase [Calidifontimicrobium sp. SYSU G02091]MCI1193255.1 allophanate hydrolase [Calidifontimicrobium sp. SYSU G02091]
MRPNESELLTIEDWRRAYLDGATAGDLVPARARRIFEHSPPASWILQVDAQALARRCAELDALARARVDRAALLAAMPLFGVPFVVKDNIDVAGLATTAACPAFRYEPAQSATVVRKLLAAGAVLLGKTNLDQFATGLVGTRSPYGAPASVFAADRISGGSSSGSAVLVGRGDVPFSLGTDTAGSGRVPAAFNNVVGLKPTPGRVGTAGVVPACRSLDCVSVFALTVEDAATVLAVIEGPDEADDYSAFAPGRIDWPQPLRVGIPRHPDVDAALGYDAGWRAACETLATLGAAVTAIDFAPLHEVAQLLYEGPWVAERLAVVEALLGQHPDAVEPTVARVIGRARDIRAVDAFRAQYALRHAQLAVRSIWREVDVLMVPTAPRHPSFDDVAADPVGANARLGVYTNFVNLLGWSALALPAGFTPNGLPFGVTFIAPGGADAALARWGRRWQQACALPLGATGQRRASAEPLTWPAAEPTLPLAVVGAHLSGQPLNGQLTERGAVWRETTTTAARYRLHALPGTRPPKPGLQRVADAGHAIEVEVWDMPLAQIGSFLALVPPPLALGSIELADGRHVHGFLCEAHALDGARDISRFGGWRAYLASL